MIQSRNTANLIKTVYHGKICSNCDIERISKQYPTELAYVLAMILARSVANAADYEGKSRVDYLSDRLGIEREETFKIIQYSA